MDQESIFNRLPKFHELDLIEGNGKIVRVFEKGAGKWDKIATRLYFDGNKIAQIRTECQNNAFKACQSTFTEWLDGKEGLRRPTAWSTVITALKEAGLGQLADDLEEILLLLETDSASAQGTKSTTVTSRVQVLTATYTPTGSQQTFPLLKHTMPGASSESYEKLQTRLYSESVSVIDSFGRTFNSIFQSLSSRDVSIKKIVANLKAFGAFSPVYKGENQSLLRDELHRLDLDTADIDDIKLIVLDYCSFFNYRLISSLVASLGTEDDKQLFEMYEAEFTEYAKRRIYECPSELGKSTNTNAILTIKLDSHYEQCSLNQLKLLEADFCKILNISNLNLCLVTSGCLQLIFQLPWFVQNEVFPLTQEQEEKLAALHVYRVTCGHYHFTVKKIQAASKVELESLRKEKEDEATHTTDLLSSLVSKSRSTKKMISSSGLDYSSVDNSTILGVDDLRDVFKEILTLRSRYHMLGLVLGLPVREMEVIMGNYPHDVDQAFSQMLLIWLRRNYNVDKYGPPTWQRLVDAVDNVDHALAKKIASKHPAVYKKPRLEDNPPAPWEEEEEREASETQEPRDPGKKQYRELSKYVQQLKALISKPEERGNDEVMDRMRDLVKKIENVCTSAVHDGEVPNPMKLIQMHLKYVLFNSEKVKDRENIKNFLSGLEDGSASTSNKDSSVFVFLANFATELWYSWNDKESQWQWTPEKWTEERKWWLWMPCSTTVVTAGQWKNETPAPENVEIIKFLDAVRPVPSDEQYLPPNFDIAELLRKLVEARDDQVRGSVKIILQAITNQRVVSKSSHVLAFLEKMSKLLQKLTVDDQPE